MTTEAKLSRIAYYVVLMGKKFGEVNALNFLIKTRTGCPGRLLLPGGGAVEMELAARLWLNSAGDTLVAPRYQTCWNAFPWFSTQEGEVQKH